MFSYNLFVTLGTTPVKMLRDFLSTSSIFPLLETLASHASSLETLSVGGCP